MCKACTLKKHKWGALYCIHPWYNYCKCVYIHLGKILVSPLLGVGTCTKDIATSKFVRWHFQNRLTTTNFGLYTNLGYLYQVKCVNCLSSHITDKCTQVPCRLIMLLAHYTARAKSSLSAQTSLYNSASWLTHWPESGECFPTLSWGHKALRLGPEPSVKKTCKGEVFLLELFVCCLFGYKK